MYREYSQLQSLLHSGVRGDKPSLKKALATESIPHNSFFGGLKSDIPLLWEKEKKQKKIHSHCPSVRLIR